MSTPNATTLLNRLQAKARIRHLQVLVALGELRSLKKTAATIGLSQPAVTQLLADLESLLDVRLFDRFSRGVQPTRAGATLIPVAQRMLEALAHGSEAISALRLEGEGSVRMAAIAGALSGLLSRAIPAFSLAHPAIQLSVTETGAMDWALPLARGEVDMAICREPTTPPDGPSVCAGDARPVRDRLCAGPPAAPPACTGLAHVAAPPLVATAGGQLGAQRVRPPGHPSRCADSAIPSGDPRFQPDLGHVAAPAAADIGALRRGWVEAGELAVIEPPEPLPFAPVGLVVPLSGQTLAAQTFMDFVVGRDWTDAGSASAARGG